MLEFKNHVGIYVVWIVVIIGIGALVFTHRIDWTIAAGFLVTLGLPSLLGNGKKGTP